LRALRFHNLARLHRARRDSAYRRKNSWSGNSASFAPCRGPAHRSLPDAELPQASSGRAASLLPASWQRYPTQMSPASGQAYEQKDTAKYGAGVTCRTARNTRKPHFCGRASARLMLASNSIRTDVPFRDFGEIHARYSCARGYTHVAKHYHCRCRCSDGGRKRNSVLIAIAAAARCCNGQGEQSIGLYRCRVLARTSAS
jgi:hypothetical protein